MFIKKILGVFLFVLLWTSNCYANEPVWDDLSLNKNIQIHGWKVLKISEMKVENSNVSEPIEVYTLFRDRWILKCTLIYKDSGQSGYCSLP